MKTFLSLLALTFTLFAALTTYSVKATGYGHSYEEAIQNALVRAVEQAKGIDIHTRKIYLRRLTQIDFHVEGFKKGSITIDDSLQGGVYSATDGFINRFKVLSVKKLDKNNYKATVKAFFSRYKSPDHLANKPTMAIIPFAAKESYIFDGVTIDGKALSRRVANALVTKLTQTGKFTVLDRENSHYYEIERRFLQDPGSDPRELARIGRRLGADYFLIGQLLDFTHGSQAANSLIGPASQENTVHVTIHYRILHVPYQRIKWADTIDTDLDLPQAKHAESLIVKISDKIAQILVSQIIFDIYPPKIVGYSGSRVIINMGGKFLHPGERFTVYRLGKKIIDPYTKESLGREEIAIGEVEVVKVLPKLSYARRIEGKAPKGAILRPVSVQEDAAPSEGKGSMFEEMFPAR